MNKNRIELFIFMIFDIKFNKINEHSTLFRKKNNTSAEFHWYTFHIFLSFICRQWNTAKFS